MKLTGEITIKTTSKYTIITVVNWEDYQSNEEITTKSLTIKQPTTNQQLTIKQPQMKNIKKYKNDKNINNNPPLSSPPLVSILQQAELDGLKDEEERGFFKNGKATQFKSGEQAAENEKKDGLRFYKSLYRRNTRRRQHTVSCIFGLI